MNARVPDAPRGDGEVFFDRDAASWESLAKAWRASSSARGAFGLNAREVREESRWPLGPTVLSAHQPVLFHPGLWAKPLTASILAERWGWQAVHKVTDQDAPGDAEGWVPTDASQAWAPQALRWTRSGEPYAFQTVPESSRLMDASNRTLSSPWPSVREAARHFSGVLQGVRAASADWDDWHLDCVRSLEDLCGTQRVYGRASRFWETVSFRRFLSRWLGEAGRFADATNRALRDYRAARGIQHPLTPVPDLAENDGWRETPFWAVNGGEGRATLWVRAQGGEILLRSARTGEVWVWNPATGPEGLAGAPWRLWPKALPQSLYTRLYLSDFFLHGLGGGFYEPVNDLFLEALNEGPAAPFGVVTATLLPERVRWEELEAVSERWERAAYWRRSLEKNPEYLVTRAEEWGRELAPGPSEACREASAHPLLGEAVAEKNGLLEGLKDPSRRAEAGRRLKDWNALWVGRFTWLYAALDAFRGPAEGIRGEREALSFRQYAFFCYPPARWRGLKDSLDRRIRKG